MSVIIVIVDSKSSQKYRLRKYSFIAIDDRRTSRPKKKRQMQVMVLKYGSEPL
jgi:hypothetical protein